MTTPHPDHIAHFEQLHEIMCDLGYWVSKRLKYTKEEYQLRLDVVKGDIAKLGSPPCPKCSTKLTLDKVNRKWVVTCGECLRTTDSYTTELQALKATRQWLQEEA